MDNAEKVINRTVSRYTVNWNINEVSDSIGSDFDRSYATKVDFVFLWKFSTECFPK